MRTSTARHDRRSLIAAVAGLVVAASTLAARSILASEDVSSILLHKTEQFSDAGQRGDGAAMARMLDDRVVFFNEGGDQATRSDMASATPSAPNGVTTHMTVTDWHCEVHGNVAVASFIDDQQQDFHGQPFHARYRSVETWLREGDEWKMIGSETIALHDDPRTVQLSAATLDEYVGTYTAAPGVTFTFARSGKDLTASTGGGAPTIQHAEVRDVFFTPGRARFTKVFERDASGRVVGFYLRREGHDTHFTRVS